jgi:hypothetical protein
MSRACDPGQAAGAPSSAADRGAWALDTQMIYRYALAAVVLLAVPGWCLAVAEEDERWIEQYVKRQSAAREVSTSAVAVGFAELPRHLGQTVRVVLVDGRERRGRVQHADRQQVTLQASVAGGSFSFGVDAAQVRRVELETAR